MPRTIFLWGVTSTIYEEKKRQNKKKAKLKRKKTTHELGLNDEINFFYKKS